MLRSVATANPKDASSFHDSLVSLQTDVLERLIVASLVASLVWFLQIGLGDVVPAVGVVVIPPTLALFSLATYYLSRAHRLTLAAAVYIGGVFVAVLMATIAYADPSLIVFLALPVGAASVLFGASIGFAAAGLISCAILGIGMLVPPLREQPNIVGHAIVYSALMATLLWVALYPLRTTFEWAWHSYEREREQTEAARTHRAELARALANLDIAYRRLESMNIELERARQAAVEARRLKAEFAANISHELRTLLNLIIGFSEMMIMSPQSYDNQPLPPAYRGDLQSIYRNAKHLSQLIDDVLDLSQIEAARMGLVKEPTSLAQIVEEAITTVAQLFKSKHLSLTVQVPESLPTIDVDRTRIRQVLINLLNNAARFTDHGGVTVSAEQKDGEIIVAVADTGIGIPEEDLNKVFEEFRQLDGSIRRRAGGSGLGLAISRHLIELHGGRIWVQSQVGRGTTFYFALPLSHEPVATTVRHDWELAPHVGTPLVQRQSLFVVTNEPRTAGLFRRYLDDYRVVPVATMSEALRRAEEEQVCAIVNAMPPGALGWIDPKNVQDSRRSVPVIAVAMRGHRFGLKDVAVVNYLTKPVLQEQFVSVLRGLGDVRQLLIVDDDHDTVRLLSRMARLAGPQYRVFKAFDGAEALEMMHKRRPDAVILDLLMPGIDGYTVLERMRSSAQLRDIPVVVVTARGREQEAITVDGLGLTRPDGFALGEAMSCVKAALDTLLPRR